MISKIKAFWENLAEETTVSKRELFLGITTCTLAGILFGVFFTPKKTVTIGSHNGCNSGNGCSSDICGTCDCCDEEE